MSGSAHLEQAVRRGLTRQALELPLPPLWADGRDLRGDHPAFPLLDTARDEALAALSRGETHYTDVAGIVPLREEVARTLATWGSWAPTRDGILVTAGEQEARFLVIEALAQSGYTLILPSVVHPGARKATGVADRRVHTLPVDPETLLPDPDEVRRVMALSSPSALYLESPNRLSGKIVDLERLEAIARAALNTDAIVLWDASLALWIPESFEYRMIGSVAGMAERTVTFGTLWPGSGVDGWLSGYIAASPDLLTPIRRLKQVTVICSPAPVQWGALGALKGARRDHRARVGLLAEIRAEAVRHVADRTLPGETATVVAVRLSDRQVDLTALPARPMPGEVFGHPGVLRFTVTKAGAVIQALRALKTLVRTAGGAQ